MRFASLLLPGIFLAQAAYSKNDIGIFEAFLMSATAVSFFWVSALFTSMLSHKADENDVQKLIQHTWIISLCCSIIGALGMLFYFRFFSSAAPSWPYQITLLLYLLFSNPAFCIEHAMLLKQQHKALFIYAFVFFILQILCPIIVILFSLPIIYLLYAITIFSALRFIYSFYEAFMQRRFVFEKAYLLLIVAASLPLVLSFLMSGAAEYVDAFLVTHFFGKGEFAVYRYGAREFPVFLLLANTLSVSMIPKIANQEQAGLSELKNRSKFLMHLAFPSLIVLVLLSKWIYPVVFNHEFAKASIYFNWYALLIISRLVFPQSILMAKKQNKMVLLSSSIELLINVSLSFLLMKSYGIVGIIWATIIAFFLDKLGMSLYCHFKLKIKLRDFIPLQTYFLYSFALIFTMIIIMFF